MTISKEEQNARDRAKYAYDVLTELEIFLFDYGAKTLNDVTLSIEYQEQEPIVTVYKPTK